MILRLKVAVQRAHPDFCVKLLVDNNECISKTQNHLIIYTHANKLGKGKGEGVSPNIDQTLQKYTN